MTELADQNGFGSFSHVDDATEILFKDGFTTANISTISGRGMGMSIIKNTIEKNSGSFRLILKNHPEPSNFLPIHFEMQFNLEMGA